MTPAEHFASPPDWHWWILGYFFFGGISGGSYALGTLLRLAGDERDHAAARIAYIVSFLALIPCPIFLTLDLGQPARFYHMLVDTSGGGIAFKLWSPMSVGSWALLLFGLFSFVSFVGAVVEGGRLRNPTLERMTRSVGRVPSAIWGIFGSGLGLFICGYTGVLLAVSNQAVWSDAGWALGGMFLASALSGSAAVLLLLARSRREVDADTTVRLESADRYFVLIEAALIAIFLVTLVAAGTVGRVLGVWLVLWLVVIAGLLAPFAAARARAWPPVAGPILALLSVLALRALVIFSAQT